jgi:hypothetical protein
MSISSFSELKTAAQDWSERSDLSAKAGDFVTLCDVRIRKALAASSLRLREMETTSDLVPTSGVCTLPTDFMAVKRVTAQTDPIRRLKYASQDWLDEAFPYGTTDLPVYFTITGASLNTAPLSAYNIRLTYYAYPAVLSDGNTTNWLLDKYPDVYLYGTLVELAAYIEDDAATQKWLGFFQGAIQGLSDAAFGASITPGTARSSTGYHP